MKKILLSLLLFSILLFSVYAVDEFSCNNFNCTGLVMHLKFNSATDNITQDSSDYNNDGELKNGASLGESSPINSGVLFDGSDDYVLIEDNESIQFGTGDFAISFWLRIDDETNENGYQDIIAKVDSYNYGIFISQDTLLTDAGKLRVLQKGSNKIFSQVLNESQWYYVVYQRNAGQGQLYVDASLQGSISYGTNLDYMGYDFSIGKNLNIANRNLEGAIDDFIMFNRSLTTDEIEQIYNGSFSSGNTITGTEENVTTSGVTDLDIWVDGTALNESGTLTGTQNLTFKDQGKTLVVVSHDFDSSGVDISTWTLTVDTGFVGIDDNGDVVGTKTIYVDKLANVDSLCVKDAAGVTSADDISDACDQANEYNFTACIGGSYSNGGGISCTDDGSKFIISGLQHSGAEQQGSENVPEFGLIGYLLASLGSYFGIKFRGAKR